MGVTAKVMDLQQHAKLRQCVGQREMSAMMSFFDASFPVRT